MTAHAAFRAVVPMTGRCYARIRRYWLEQHGGPDVEAAFLDAIADGAFTLVDLTTGDVARLAEQVRQFSSLPLGGTDSRGHRDR